MPINTKRNPRPLAAVYNKVDQKLDRIYPSHPIVACNVTVRDFDQLFPQPAELF